MTTAAPAQRSDVLDALDFPTTCDITFAVGKCRRPAVWAVTCACGHQGLCCQEHRRLDELNCIGCHRVQPAAAFGWTRL